MTQTDTPEVRPSEVWFEVDGVRCAADLYLPPQAVAPAPCVVMAHGFSGTKGGLQRQACEFANAGIAALVFDYRHFGESGGMPRQLIDIRRQLADYRAAIQCARLLPGVDAGRIALWGTSLSGGHVITVAADDPRVAAVIAQVPWVGIDFTRKDPRGTGATLRLYAGALLDFLAAALRLPPLLLPVVGAPGDLAAFNDPRAQEAVEAMSVGTSGWVNAFTARTLVGLLRYRPWRRAAALRQPLLVCIADEDTYASVALAVRAAKAAPRGELRRYPMTHFEAYLGGVEGLIEDQVTFLRHCFFDPARS